MTFVAVASWPWNNSCSWPRHSHRRLSIYSIRQIALRPSVTFLLPLYRYKYRTAFVAFSMMPAVCHSFLYALQLVKKPLEFANVHSFCFSFRKLALHVEPLPYWRLVRNEETFHEFYVFTFMMVMEEARTQRLGYRAFNQIFDECKVSVWLA